MQASEVTLSVVKDYNQEDIFRHLPDEIFNCIKPGDAIIIKPNWLRDSHLTRRDEWEQVITHPDVISAVLRKVFEKLSGKGTVTVTDGPETSASFEKIMSHYPVKEWESDALKEGIKLTILDLRDEEWTDDGNVVTERKNLPGDPLGSTEVNLKGEASEFFGHRPANGYFGADSDIKETNAAHDGTNNLYRISRTVAGCDVFINIPKLKTHKKAGITCNLKNLVGINTYRNFLPHSSIGTIKDGGDQFPVKTASTGIESKLMPFIHQKILKYPGLAKLFSPFIGLGKRVFGDNTKTIRGGSWYGNDTIWRMILDINKVLFYSDAQGRMKEGTIDKAKRYISVVDGIIAGEGEGPKMPDAVRMGYLICGTNPVAVDSVCAVLMGFDPMKIPSLKNAFSVSKYKLTGFGYDDIRLVFGGKIFEIEGIPPALVKKLKPHRGWTGHLEKN